jgi:hypothetical protein
MTGADAFAGAMKTVQNSFEQLSRSMDRTPNNVDKHFGQMAKAAQATAQSIQRSMTMAKTAMAAVLTAKGMGAGFDWALGSKDVSDAKSFLRASGMDETTMAAYEKQLNANRKKMISDKQDYWKSVREIDSAFANKPLDQRIGVAAMMPHYQKLLRMSQEESAQFIKQMDASFGQFLPADKQATFVSDLLGRIHAASTTTKVNANEITQAATAVSPTYLQMGRSLDDMVSELAYMIPSMGSAEKAATSIRNTWTQAGEVYGKLAAEVTEANFRQRFMGKSPWKTMEDLKFAANFQGNEQAQEMLKTLKAHKEYFGEKEQAEAGRILTQEKNIPKYMNTVGQLVDRLKAEGGDWMGKLGDIVGRENVNGFLRLLDGYRSGMIDQTKKSIQVGGQQAISYAENQGMKGIWDKWGLVKQQAEDLSGDFKKMFEEPLIKIMEQWKTSLEELRSIIGKDATGDIQKNISGFTTGLFGGLSKGLLGSDKSFSDWSKGQLGGMQSQGWDKAGESIGEKFGGAISTFATAAQKFAEIVSYIHGLLPKEEKEKPKYPATQGMVDNAATAVGAGAGYKIAGAPGAAAGAYGARQIAGSSWGLTALGAGVGALLGIPFGPAGMAAGALYGGLAGGSVKPLQSIVEDQAQGRGIDMHGGGHEMNSYMNQPSQVVVQPNTKVENKIEIIADEEKLAGALSARVKSEIKEEMSSERDRSRQNALDGFMGR